MGTQGMATAKVRALFLGSCVPTTTARQRIANLCEGEGQCSPTVAKLQKQCSGTVSAIRRQCSGTVSAIRRQCSGAFPTGQSNARQQQQRQHSGAASAIQTQREQARQQMQPSSLTAQPPRYDSDALELLGDSSEAIEERRRPRKKDVQIEIDVRAYLKLGNVDKAPQPQCYDSSVRGLRGDGSHAISVRGINV